MKTEEKIKFLETQVEELKKLAPCDGTGACSDGKCIACKLINEQLASDQLRADLDKQVSVALGQMQTITKLRAQLAEATKDKQRLDWLGVSEECCFDNLADVYFNYPKPNCKKIRQAIDAAIEAQKK